MSSFHGNESNGENFMTRSRQFVFSSSLVGLAALTGAAHAAEQHYGITISTAATTNVTFSKGTFSPTGSDAVLNVNDLTNALASGNVEVTTGMGTGGGPFAGNIKVEAGFTWTGAGGLTLVAYRSILVDQAVVNAGTGALTLNTGLGASDGVFKPEPGGSIAIWNLSNALSINGQAYTLVGDIRTLASDIAANPSGVYALANAYDASQDGTYLSAPIPTLFKGQFEGMGNAIANLVIKIGGSGSRKYIGLFSRVDMYTDISDLHLTNVNLNAEKRGAVVGALVGLTYGGLQNDSVDGMVTDRYSRTARGSIGGLAGVAETVFDCHASVAVSTVLGTAGGLVGVAGTITDSSATGSVTLAESGTGSAGSAGGLAGSAGSVTDSFASGTVTAVGYNFVGGLAGTGGSTITNSYATGAVTGGDNAVVGGLIGYDQANSSAIADSYSTGAVAGGTGSAVGGFAGGITGVETSTDDYWDTTTSGTNVGVGSGSSAGIIGLTTAQLQAGLPTGFDPTLWAEAPSINNGLPYLIANKPQ
jgi:hypothetical protein